MKTRSIKTIIPAVGVTDGAGVKLRRSLGAGGKSRHDPFLLLDEFFSENPEDYVGGFPPHPHRGFETVTYLLAGRMSHEDHLGNHGDLGPGDVQWMSAGRGIIHSEMPRQSQGRLRGFQLWINLPAAEKMSPARYRDISNREIPVVRLEDGGEARIIAGGFERGEGRVEGPIRGAATDPRILDLRLPEGALFQMPLDRTYNALMYVYEGRAGVGDSLEPLPLHAAALLSDGDTVLVQGGPQGSRLLLLAAKPLGEPVVQYGPFVMNTREEVDQALADYRSGVLTSPAASLSDS